MRYKPGHREQAKTHILGAAGRGFRKSGFGGIGVDGLAKEAGMTSGAFYGHFKSKDAAFQEVILHGLTKLNNTITTMQNDLGPAWAQEFIDFYLGIRRTCDISDSCTLQSLSSEVVRACDDTRNTYREHLNTVVETVACGLDQIPESQRMDKAWALLSILSGGVTVARAVNDKTTSDTIAQALRGAALDIINT